LRLNRLQLLNKARNIGCLFREEKWTFSRKMWLNYSSFTLTTFGVLDMVTISSLNSVSILSNLSESVGSCFLMSSDPIKIDSKCDQVLWTSNHKQITLGYKFDIIIKEIDHCLKASFQFYLVHDGETFLPG
jgi:hypothetical protein